MKSLPDPEITLSYKDGMKLDSIANNICYFNITLVNRKAPSKNIKIQTYFITEENGKYFLITDPKKSYFIFPYGENLGTETSFEFHINIPYNNANTIYCLLKGTYTNMNKDKTYSLRKIYSYEIKNKKFGMPLNPYYEPVENFLNENGIL